MTDPRREGGRDAKTTGNRPEPEGGEERKRTPGTDRDFDESQKSKNQGHGHPREEMGRKGNTDR